MLLRNRQKVAFALSWCVVSLAVGACVAKPSPGGSAGVDLTSADRGDGGSPRAPDAGLEQLADQELPEEDGYSYVHGGKAYDYGNWSEVATGEESMVALGDVVYVFDTESEARAFEDGELKSMLDGDVPAVNATSGARTSTLAGAEVAVGETVWGTAVFQLKLYEHKDYSGRYYSFWCSQQIGRKRTRIGYEWVNNKLDQNLPTSFRKLTSSYKMEYTTVPKIDGYWMVLEMKLRTGLLEDDRNVNWKKKLYRNPEMGTSNTVEQDSDFSNNRIWAQLGIGTWNDHIQSFSMSFNSY